MTKEIRIADIALEESTQARAGLHEDAVGDYRSLMERGVEFPPVSLMHDGEKHYVIDGFHRIQAAQDLKRKKISADVKKGSKEEAAWLACAANQTHGTRRSRSDLRVAIQTALGLRPKASNLAIAKHIGVSQNTVDAVRQEMVARFQIENAATRTDSSGREQPARKPRAAAPPATSAEAPAEDTTEPPRDPVDDWVDWAAVEAGTLTEQRRCLDRLHAINNACVAKERAA